MEIFISGSFVEQSNTMTAFFFPFCLKRKKKINLQAGKIFFLLVPKKLSQFLYGLFSSFLYYLCNGYNSQITTPQALDMFHR